METRKTTYRKYVKPSDKFYKETLFKVLECLYWEEGDWNSENWQKYGISDKDYRKVKAEFFTRINNKK
jgi:hypothetical protein